jgi:hypothetical protein
MSRYASKSMLLLGFSVVICCILYPLVLWVIGQAVFPFQANGSMLQGPDGQPVGSQLIAQPFTKDEYFQPRPSAASYNASASASSTYAASNYLLRDRVARALAQLSRIRAAPRTESPWRPMSRPGFSRINTRATRTSSHSGLICITRWLKPGSLLTRATASTSTVGRSHTPVWLRSGPGQTGRPGGRLPG